MEEQNKVNIEVVSVDDLIQDDHNFNKGTEQGQQLIERSFRECGAGRSVFIDKDNRLVGGNKAQKGFKAAGKKRVVIVDSDPDTLVAVRRKDVSLDSAEGRRMALLDNLTTQVNLAWDPSEIEAVSSEIDGFDPSDYGFDPSQLEVAGMGDETTPAKQTEVKEDDFDPDAHYETKVKAGEVWQLGEHRLMCGDSLNEADVLKLLNGEHAPLTFTDPPYRLATEGGGVLKAANSMKQIKQNGVDEFEPSKLKLYSETNIYSHNKPLIKNYILLAEREGKPYDLAIYKKQGLPNYAGHLMTDLEYIAVIGDQGPKKGLDFETYSKLYVGKKDADNELSYSKPVALCGKFIMLYSDKGDIVLDIFGGSGSTMIACEQLNRKCRMMELDPHYCDVIIARWEKLTGQKAVKLTP